VAEADPRTTLAFAVAAAAAGAAGTTSALVTLASLLVWAAASRRELRPLATRLIPVALGFAGFALAAAFAPRETGAVVLRGFASSAALVVIGGEVPWTRTVGALQTLGAPRSLVALLAIVARHLVTLREDAEQLRRTLVLRGAFVPGTRVRGVRVLLENLLASALTRADRVADALTLRGFEGRLPVAGPWRPGRGDLFVGLLTVLVGTTGVVEWLR